MDLLPKSPANSPGGSPHEHRAKEARETFFEGYSKLDKGTVAGTLRAPPCPALY